MGFLSIFLKIQGQQPADIELFVADILITKDKKFIQFLPLLLVCLLGRLCFCFNFWASKIISLVIGRVEF